MVVDVDMRQQCVIDSRTAAGKRTVRRSDHATVLKPPNSDPRTLGYACCFLSALRTHHRGSTATTISLAIHQYRANETIHNNSSSGLRALHLAATR